MALQLSDEDLRRYCARLCVLLTSVKSEENIATRLGLSWADYEELKSKMLEIESLKIQEKSAEATYVEYVIKQETNIKDLTDMITKFKESKQHAAMVSAVKARAEIYDKMISVGQELGFIKKVPERTEVIAGVMVAEMSNDDLRAAIAGELASLDALMKKHGEGHITDLTPGQLHFSDAPESAVIDVTPEPPPLQLEPPKPVKAVKGHSRNRVYKGRRVVKTPVDV